MPPRCSRGYEANALFWDIIRQGVVCGSPDSQRQRLEMHVQTQQQQERFLQYLDESVLKEHLPADKVNVMRQILVKTVHGSLRAAGVAWMREPAAQ